MSTGLLEVTIDERPVFEEVDAEIVVVAGCALGFVSTRCPPHVLHIEENSSLDKAGIEMDDILYMVGDSVCSSPHVLHIVENAKNIFGKKWETW